MAEDEDQDEKKTTEEKQEEIGSIDGCLPQELITEILLRSSIKSVVRFRSVCKSWNNLISSQSFTKSHVHGVKNPASLLLLRVTTAHAKGFRFYFYLYRSPRRMLGGF